MQRRKVSVALKLEAVTLVRDRGVPFAQAARDLDLHANVLRNWVLEAEADARSAFPGNGQVKPEQQEIERLCVRLKARRAHREPSTVRPAQARWSGSAVPDRTARACRSWHRFSWNSCARFRA